MHTYHCPAEQSRVLRDDPKSPSQVVHTHVFDIDPVNQNAPFEFDKSEEARVQERGFARPSTPDDTYFLPRRDVDVDVVENEREFWHVPHAEVLYLDLSTRTTEKWMNAYQEKTITHTHSHSYIHISPHTRKHMHIYLIPLCCIPLLGQAS
jgi:hypothetical protein